MFASAMTAGPARWVSKTTLATPRTRLPQRVDPREVIVMLQAALKIRRSRRPVARLTTSCARRASRGTPWNTATPTCSCARPVTSSTGARLATTTRAGYCWWSRRVVAAAAAREVARWPPLGKRQLTRFADFARAPVARRARPAPRTLSQASPPAGDSPAGPHSML